MTNALSDSRVALPVLVHVYLSCPFTITVPFLISQLETCRDKTGPAFEVIQTHRELRPESSSLLFANENRRLESCECI